MLFEIRKDANNCLYPEELAGTLCSSIGCEWKSTAEYISIEASTGCPLGVINNTKTEYGYNASALTNGTAIGVNATSNTGVALGTCSSSIGAGIAIGTGVTTDYISIGGSSNTSSINIGSGTAYSNSINIGNSCSCCGSVTLTTCNITNINGVVVGNNSVSSTCNNAIVGYNNTVTCNSAYVFGVNNNISNQYSVALGYCNSIANGDSAVSIGVHNNICCGIIAIGNGNTSDCAQKSITIGDDNTACHTDAILIGHDLTSSNDYDVKIGCFYHDSSKNYLCGNGCLLTGRILESSSCLPLANCDLILYYVP